jgi:hypothetical protein
MLYCKLKFCKLLSIQHARISFDLPSYFIKSQSDYYSCLVGVQSTFLSYMRCLRGRGLVFCYQLKTIISPNIRVTFQNGRTIKYNFKNHKRNTSAYLVSIWQSSFCANNWNIKTWLATTYMYVIMTILCYNDNTSTSIPECSHEDETFVNHHFFILSLPGYE